MNNPTPFTEANALLAVQIGDLEEAQRLVESMLPNELRELAIACENLAAICWRRL